MRVVCPLCAEAITISDDLAGQATFCPQCKSAFTAPTLMPVPPPAPPALVPPPMPISSLGEKSSVVFGKDATMSAPATIPFPAPATPPGYSRSVGLALLPEMVQWLAPVALVLTVILTFFPWSGAYPGDHAVYTQTPWGALFASFSSDPVGDKVLQLDTVAEGSSDKSVRDQIHTNWFMLPYLPGLLVTAALAIAFTLLPTLKVKLPPQLEKLVPWRMAIIAVLGFLLTGIVVIQSLRGFGLENALREKVDALVQKEHDRAKTPEEIKTFEIRRGSIIDGWNVEQTTANRLALMLHVVAVLGAAGTFLMSRRADKPAPRLELMW